MKFLILKLHSQFMTSGFFKTFKDSVLHVQTVQLTMYRTLHTFQLATCSTIIPLDHLHQT